MNEASETALGHTWECSGRGWEGGGSASTRAFQTGRETPFSTAAQSASQSPMVCKRAVEELM